MGKKRSNGEGTIRHLVSGRWSWAVMIGRNPDGSPQYYRVTADTRTELNEKINEFKRKNGTHPKAVPGFKNFSEEWWKRYKVNLRVSTQSSYIYTLQKLQSYWENTSIDQIKTSNVFDMLQYYHREEGLSASYVEKLRGLSYQIFEAAEAEELIAKNPVRYVTYRASQDIQFGFSLTKKDAFSVEEITKVCQAPQSKIKDFISLAFATGIRLQELLALCGDDIAENGERISVTKAINMDGGIPVIGSTKNTSSVREIPVPSEVQHVAAKYRVYGRALIWESPQKSGEPINPSSFRKKFKRFCEEIGIRCLTPHCCRHTYVTQLRAHKVDAEVVKALVGHSRNGVTEVYNHIPWDSLVEAAEMLNDLFKNKKADPKRSA